MPDQAPEAGTYDLRHARHTLNFLQCRFLHRMMSCAVAGHEPDFVRYGGGPDGQHPVARHTGRVLRRTPLVLVVALVTLAALTLGGCSGDEAADDDRIVLVPDQDGGGHTHAAGQSDATPIGDGTKAAAGGYRLDAVSLAGGAGGPRELGFRILGPDGPVTELVEEQTKLLHLYVVSSDLSVFRHLHPELAADGTWSTLVDLGEPGAYRVLAEFTPAGSERPVALGTEVRVPGAWEPEPVPTGAESATDDDGVVRVAVDGSGELGPDGRLRLVVSDLDGRPLQLGSYLGTAAHVTGFALEGGRFIHVHPYGEPEQTDDGTRLTFHTTFEQAGDYRLFVQVRVGGFVHTVPVTATVS